MLSSTIQLYSEAYLLFPQTKTSLHDESITIITLIYPDLYHNIQNSTHLAISLLTLVNNMHFYSLALETLAKVLNNRDGAN